MPILTERSENDGLYLLQFFLYANLLRRQRADFRRQLRLLRRTAAAAQFRRNADPGRSVRLRLRLRRVDRLYRVLRHLTVSGFRFHAKKERPCGRSFVLRISDYLSVSS